MYAGLAFKDQLAITITLGRYGRWF